MPNPLSCPSELIAQSQLPETTHLPAALLTEDLMLVQDAAIAKGTGATDFTSPHLRTEAPPELTPTWAFTHRTSLPSRAPSALA